MDKTNQTISDDQELAKVLAGVSQEADGNMQFEETGNVTPPVITPIDPSQANPVVASDDSTAADATAPVVAPPIQPIADPSLDNIKQTALTELRPLIGKLNVSPEEKFDTYLLLLRSTDDKELIAPAHDAAVAIVDEARRAQALLDIIKEIDYLSAPKQ